MKPTSRLQLPRWNLVLPQPSNELLEDEQSARLLRGGQGTERTPQRYRPPALPSSPGSSAPSSPPNTTHPNRTSSPRERGASTLRRIARSKPTTSSAPADAQGRHSNIYLYLVYVGSVTSNANPLCPMRNTHAASRVRLQAMPAWEPFSNSAAATKAALYSGSDIRQSTTRWMYL